MRCRVRVEVEWFIALASAGLAGIKPPGPAAIEFLSRLVAGFSVADAEAIKAIEQRTRERQGGRAENQHGADDGGELIEESHAPKLH